MGLYLGSSDEIKLTGLSGLEGGMSGPETDPIFVNSVAFQITQQDIINWNNKSDFSGSYNDLSNIPTIPINISDLTNDVGYITSFTETDPTVPSWAKAQTKPSYTYDEINSKPTTINGYGITDAYTKTEINNIIMELPQPMLFKGSVGIDGTITTLPVASSENSGFVYKVITNGAYASQSAKTGDTFISDGETWVLIPSGDEPSGTVISITAGAGLTGGTITSSGTINSLNSNWLNGSNTGSVRTIGSTEENSNYTIGQYAIAEGYETSAEGNYSHAEGRDTFASGSESHAEGFETSAEGTNSHAEGLGTTASGNYSHAEGGTTNATGVGSHAEGDNTYATGYVAHAEGYYSQANGTGSHAEGCQTIANGQYSYTNGYYTQAERASQTVIGKFNILDNTKGSSAQALGEYVFIIGNGIQNARSNALTVDWDGNVNIPAGASYQIDGNPLSFVISTSIEINVSDWSSLTNSAVKTNINGITASNNIIIAPAPISMEDCSESNVRCVDQENGSLTFNCDIIPSNSITMNILILN